MVPVVKDREKPFFEGDIPTVDQGVDVPLNLTAIGEQAWLETGVSIDKLPESRDDTRTFR